MARDKVLTIKVSAEEKARIVEAARQNRRTYSDWSRLVLTAECDEMEIPLGTVLLNQESESKSVAA